MWLLPVFLFVWFFGGFALLDWAERRHFRADEAWFLRTGEHLPEPWWWVD